MDNLSKTLGKLTIPLLVLLAICFWASPAQAKYGGGTGEPNDPYLIFDANQMNAIGADSNDWDKHFKLMADIDLSGYTGTSFNIIGYLVSWDDNKSFNGVFDGNGHTILNFTCDSNDRDYIGLFGYVYGGDIKNLGLIDPNVDAGTGEYVGALVGWLYDGNITDCYVEGGSVEGYYYVGGLIGTVGDLRGYSNTGTVTNCYSTCTVSGYYSIGGLVGINRGTITNCDSSSGVSGFRGIGGLTGNNRGGTISICYSTGDVEGDERVGGLVGGNGGKITNSYASGGVLANEEVGGLVGRNGWYLPAVIVDFGTIYNCYSTSSVIGTTAVGGLVGYNEYGEVLTSFWDTETKEQATSDGGTGKTTAEMQTMSTFTYAGWGCELVWTIDDGVDYPRLWWENKPGELIIKLSYCQGSGTEADPYLIYTSKQLNMIGLFSCDWDKHFKLMADIDLSSFTGTSFNIIGINPYIPFSGVFDGNGHTILNFTCDSNDRDYIGLFGYVSGGNSEIKNLELINPNVDAGTGAYVGSLAGRNGGNINNCYVEGESVTGEYHVGGLVGSNYNGTITNCYSTGSVSGQSSVGGLVGWNSGTITNCYSTSGVSGDRYVGGLVGLNYRTITNCYSTGSVSGNYRVGGLVGSRSIGGYAIASFWDIQTSGLVTSAGGWGLPTAQMQMKATFTDAGWDFLGETVNGVEDIWFIPERDYPHLWWEGMQVSMKLTPRTLNCRSYGNWVKAHLTLPEGFTVADVDSNRPAVLHSFGFESAPLYVFVNENELVEIEAAFEREAVCSLAGNWPEALTVAGFLTDGNIFLGTSKVRMITPGMKDIEELALYWLNADCVQPDWCDGIDLNGDSMVNLLDYALLLNSQVEFIRE